jgi:hypothetical protein
LQKELLPTEAIVQSALSLLPRQEAAAVWLALLELTAALAAEVKAAPQELGLQVRGLMEALAQDQSAAAAVEQVLQAEQQTAAMIAQDQEAVVLTHILPGQAQPPLGLAVITLAAEAGGSKPLQAPSAQAAQAAADKAVRG